MTIATNVDAVAGELPTVQLTPLQMRVEKARFAYDTEFTKVEKLRRRILNTTEKLITLAVYAGQKREKWLILMAMQEQAEANGTS